MSAPKNARSRGALPLGWRLMTMMRVAPSGCWLWTGYLNPQGYPRVSIDGRQTMAHRACYEFFVADIPKGMTLDHRCRERACINPYHLEVVTLRENILRGNATGAVNARKTHCERGHPLSGSNLYAAPNARRVCRTCRRANNTTRMRAWRAEQKAAA